MNDPKLLAALLTCGSYRSDPIVKALCEVYSDDIFRAVGAYAAICEVLCEKCLTLSEYMTELAAGGSIPGEYLRRRDELSPEVADMLYGAFSSDVAILAELSAVSCETLKERLRKSFRNLPERLPSYPLGSETLTPEAVLGYRRRYGSPLFKKYKAFTFERGELVPMKRFDGVSLKDFKNYDTQRAAVTENTRRLAAGLPHNNVLLYGDRGTGKSSTVKAAANEFENIRIIFIPKGSISDICALYEKVRGCELGFIFFIDDLTAENDDPAYTTLKQALEGSLAPVPENAAVYATTNRRHIVRENADRPDETERHAADARDESLTLYDRFGLVITFMLPDKKCYLEITEKLAADAGIKLPREELFAAAERFALGKGSRSPRTAKQFIGTLKGEEP